MAKRKTVKPPSTVWDLYRDGISYSLLSKFEVCRDRFHTYAVRGLRPAERKEALEFGTIFHKALELHAQGNTTSQTTDKLFKWAKDKDVSLLLCRIAAMMVSHYTAYWKAEKLKYHSSEQVFRIPHTTRYLKKNIELRGRLDETFIRNGKIWLQENKTKSNIDESKIISILPQDLQTMLYCYAMTHIHDLQIGGVLYNVIRKPQLKQGVKESETEYLNRIHEDITERPDHYFKRFEVELSKGDIKKFVAEILDPLLDQVVMWWESIKLNPLNPWVSKDTDGNEVPNPHHYRKPFGIYDPMTNGKGDYFELVTSGSTLGLERIETCFPELDGEQGSDFKPRKA